MAVEKQGADIRPENSLNWCVRAPVALNGTGDISGPIESAVCRYIDHVGRDDRSCARVAIVEFDLSVD